MKEEGGDKKHDNNCGVVGVVLGILALVFVIMPFIGLILGTIGIIFAYKQKKKMSNSWATAGLWMGGIAILLNVIWDIYYIIISMNLATQYLEQARALQASGLVGAPA